MIAKASMEALGYVLFAFFVFLGAYFLLQTNQKQSLEESSVVCNLAGQPVRFTTIYSNDNNYSHLVEFE